MSRPVALVFDPLSWVTDFGYETERDLLDEHGVELVVPASAGERAGLMSAASVLVACGTSDVTADDIAALGTDCVGIVSAQVGMDQIDLEAASTAGLVVVNVTPSTEEVADHAMALVLTGLRRLPLLGAEAERRRWDPLTSPVRGELRRLRGSTMGIIGPGRIGRAVARRAAPFGFRVVGAARRPRPETHRGTVSPDDADAIEMVDIEALLGRSDVIVVCADANPTSVGLLDRAAFARAKPGVVVVNVTRGALIDEDALVDALDSGIVAFAALDVRRDEPPSAGDRLTGHPRVFQTPHVAGASMEAGEDLHRMTAARVLDVLADAGRIDLPPAAPPPVDVTGFHHVDEFEEVAARRLAPTTYGYVAGGAGREHTVHRNRESLDSLRLVPRILRDVETIDTAITVLGTDFSFPLMIAPSAVQRLGHADGELATARAAAASGIPMILSMNASTTVEAVAAEGVSFWMQLYCSRDRAHMARVIDRAGAAGAAALCLTVDHAGMPTRVRELHHPLVVPPEVEFVHLDPDPARRAIDRSLTWEVIDWLGEVSDLPVVLKGVLHPEDARLAVEAGVGAVIASNHGGRQLDGSVSAYDVVEAMREAVGDRIPILVDGGIRSGTDLLKGLALGGRVGLVGRAVWWGLATAGQDGVRRVIDLIRVDFEEAMRLCGLARPEEISRALLA